MQSSNKHSRINFTVELNKRLCGLKWHSGRAEIQLVTKLHGKNCDVDM